MASLQLKFIEESPPSMLAHKESRNPIKSNISFPSQSSRKDVIIKIASMAGWTTIPKRVRRLFQDTLKILSQSFRSRSIPRKNMLLTDIPSWMIFSPISLKWVVSFTNPAYNKILKEPHRANMRTLNLWNWVNIKNSIQRVLSPKMLQDGKML